tara:strand:- start:32734 stop:34167 length:1434 start_codon:yes stop_codon:yes gene_type:complete
MPTIEEVLQQGWRLHQAGRVDDAAAIYRHVLDQAPRSAEAHVYLGIAQFDQRDFRQSAASYREAIRLRDSFPVAWNNLGNSLRMSGDVDEAESCFVKALQQQPGYLSALKNRGTLWVWAGEIERGLHWYQEALKVKPDDPELHRNLGVINLLLGEFEIGWPEYRWRWRMPGMRRPQTNAPFWQGEQLDGKTVLLYPEQGRGDTIQFIRMATELHDAGARVFIECPQELIPLLQSVRGVDMFLPEGAVIPPVDYHLSLIDAVDVWYCSKGELPLSTDTRHGYLNVPEAKALQWRRWLDQTMPQSVGKPMHGRLTHGKPVHGKSIRDRPMRVGINWQGSPDHHADVYRSVPLDCLAVLANRADIQLVSLQFGHGADDLDACDFADSVVKVPAGVDTSEGAFVDTAAIVKGLDVVVTSDTAIAHLAGALGVPVQLMLGKVPDWRWRLDGDTTVWYDTFTLVRQQHIGDWNSVAASIASKF